MGKIIYFTDLEGTILREKDGDYNQEDMMRFLEQLNQLEKLMNSKVCIHIVSPIYIEDMQNMLDRIDSDIIKYNQLNNASLNLVEEATCSLHNDFYYSESRKYDRIIPFFETTDIRTPDIGRSGKLQYVEAWLNAHKYDLCIYSGNGRNDVGAMELIQKMSNGFVICPINSRHQILNKADFKSEKEDIKGITDGLEQLNKKIEKHKNSNEKKCIEIEDNDR